MAELHDFALQGRLSPAWETIGAARHIFLTLCNFHSVTAYELPLYQPSPAEQSDAILFAKNVRDFMVRQSGSVLPAAAVHRHGAGMCSVTCVQACLLSGPNALLHHMVRHRNGVRKLHSMSAFQAALLQLLMCCRCALQLSYQDSSPIEACNCYL